MNNRKILNGFYSMNGMAEKAGEIMRTVDKLDKIGAEKVRLLLIDEVKMLPCKAENVMDFMAIRGNNEEVLEALSRYRGMDATFDEGLQAFQHRLMLGLRADDVPAPVDLLLRPAEEGQIICLRSA